MILFFFLLIYFSFFLTLDNFSAVLIDCWLCYFFNFQLNLEEDGLVFPFDDMLTSFSRRPIIVFSLSRAESLEVSFSSSSTSSQEDDYQDIYFSSSTSTSQTVLIYSTDPKGSFQEMFFRCSDSSTSLLSSTPSGSSVSFISYYALMRAVFCAFSTSFSSSEGAFPFFGGDKLVTWHVVAESIFA